MNFFAQSLCVTLSALLILPPLQAQVAGSDLQINVVDEKSESKITVMVLDGVGTPVPDAAVVVRMPDTGPTGIFKDGTHSAVLYTDAGGNASVGDIRWSDENGPCSIRITATRGSSHAGILLEHVVRKNATQLASVKPSVIAAPAPVVENSVPVPVPAQVAAPEPTPLPIPRVAAESTAPKVSVVNTSNHEKIRGAGSSKKWLIIALIAAGAGAGVAMAGKRKSSASSPSQTSGVSIGNPTVSVGNP